MFSKFLKRRPQSVRAPETPSVPDDMVVWAVGDIHGRLDLLVPLVEQIITDATASSAERKIVIFLGDYIDRGRDSRGVIQYLSGLQVRCSRIDWHFLKGNHEETMLKFLQNPSVGLDWCQYGGAETLHSYGLKPPSMKHRPDAWKHVSDDLDHKLSVMEKKFLNNLEISFTAGDYFFCHAGARPEVSLERQADADLIWIRRSFLDSPYEFEKVVVHGHTPTNEVHVDRRRIGVDTKAYETGVLSAIVLCGSQRHVLQSSSAGMVISSPLG